MNCSVIDIGANTVRLNIFAIKNNKPVLLFNKKETCGLAYYKERNILSQKGVDLLVSTLTKFDKLLQYYPVDQRCVFATASLRNIKNTREVVNYVKEKTGLSIDILSDKQEANLGFMGISSSVGNTWKGISVDIGGGSTEIVYFEKGEILKIYNLDEGCLSLHKKFVKGVMPKKSELKKAKYYLEERIEDFVPYSKVDHLIGIGGTIRSTGKILENMGSIQDRRKFRACDAEKLYYDFIDNKSKKPFDSLMKAAPDRIHTIQTGLAILTTVCEHWGVNTIEVSTTGLREGYVINKLNEMERNFI